VEDRPARIPFRDEERSLATPAATGHACAFCGGESSFIYRMGDYPVHRCGACGTGFVHTMPKEDTLRALYDGFLPRLEAGRLPRFLALATELYAQLGLEQGHGLEMLDIGGGGGFFSKAFEELGYGRATYLDLDPQSCRFARHELGLERVLNVDAMDLAGLTSQRYDFIYCRHVIEHLVDPCSFLARVTGALADHGMLVVQFPNGDSLEYLAYTHRGIRQRLYILRSSNGFSRLRTIVIVLTGGMLHDLDPPRHLWAISRRGIECWAERHGLACRTFCRHLGDEPFSPGYSPWSDLSGRIKDFVGQHLLSRLRGGAHLVAVLRKSR
jgi:SAM-dependent methyltransferase